MNFGKVESNELGCVASWRWNLVNRLKSGGHLESIEDGKFKRVLMKVGGKFQQQNSAFSR
jgi:hypothetical protein